MLQRTDPRLVALDRLVEEPYSSVLAYPERTAQEVEARIGELERLGIKQVIFEGSSKIGKLGVLGKGCIGIVVKALLDGSEVALKIRRTDADRATMEREAGFLKIANGAGVGPKLLASSRNFLAIELAGGVKIIDWLKPDRSRDEIVSVARQILEQCFRLDGAGLDHGELSNLNKHVLVGERVTIIDFESASAERRVSNVTSVAQWLFVGGPMAQKVRDILGIGSTDIVIKALRSYKNESIKENFESLLSILGLR